MSIKAVKDATMGPHMSGRFTSGYRHTILECGFQFMMTKGRIFDLVMYTVLWVEFMGCLEYISKAAKGTIILW